ncbi:MAG TPA: hypothetical protein VFP56_04785 [Candidatus Limnocylindrales bacterium]|nr:hypothetical protein [Candidatus Limnocylindrales bacterium]
MIVAGIAAGTIEDEIRVIAERPAEGSSGGSVVMSAPATELMARLGLASVEELALRHALHDLRVIDWAR